MDVRRVIAQDSRLARLAQRVTTARLGLGEGLWGSAAAWAAAEVALRLGRPLLLITAHGDEADDVRDDVETYLGTTPDLLPQLETAPGEQRADDELAAERLRLCVALLEHAAPSGAASKSPAAPDTTPRVIVAPIQALMQPVPAAEHIVAQSRQVAVGQRVDPDELERWLAEHNFTRCEQVETPGDYARRGGIVDVFTSAFTQPVRLEFFGDEVESIRLFDAGTQRSAQALGSVRIPALDAAPRTAVATEIAADAQRWFEEDDDEPDQDSLAGAGEIVTRTQRRPWRSSAGPAEQTSSFLSYLPADTLIGLLEPTEIQELGRTYLQRVGERVGIIPADAVLRRAASFHQAHLQRFISGDANAVNFDVGGLPQFEARGPEALAALAELAAGAEVTVLCDNSSEQQRFQELLSGARITPAAKSQNEEALADAEKHAALDDAARAQLRRVRTTVGVLHRGFIWRVQTDDGAAPLPIALIPHHELFSRYRQRRTLRRVHAARAIDSFFDLNPGDYVVHVLHGIGRFVGLKTLEQSGKRDEYLAIEYADSATIHVPVSQIHVVQKYIGSKRGKPALSKLGGNAWKRTKERVAASVTDLAAELLAIQAQRATQPGIAYPSDTTWQNEFDGSFLYSETPDQLRAISEIKGDMTNPRPMDRLLCGDVGYGKTELAMRAAFKAVEYGKQVAVLAPTTVLAEQHRHTFSERFADYPFVIEVLNRFRTKKEQTEILQRTARGQVDILIGTHRLLSKDVKFSDLGLVIIDEEQRFGVEAKERLKRMRATVDVLTLSATPIPRTLHMAMLGIRDISSLATAPVDRRAIVTQVRMWDNALIREAIVRELNRDGQVYFVHNFVRDLHNVANQIRSIVPEARVVVGHGQMDGEELEQVMLTFVNRDADVLVATNIIESGIDIPTANTIFINRAERFGLADLHQLRGRVGRSKHRAYCYLLLSPRHPVKDTAARRLKAIEHYSELGAGFQIAMRDLEIRGAGNILGSEQSGNIEAVGYEMYCQLLEEAGRRLRQDPTEPWRNVNLELGLTASIPRAYIRGDKQRMDVYKRMTACRSSIDVTSLRSDLVDAYGPLPPDVETLLTLAEIRVLSQRWAIRSIVLQPPDVIFAVDEVTRAQPLFEGGPGSPRIADSKTIHWRLPKSALQPERLLPLLVSQLAAKTQLAETRPSERPTHQNGPQPPSAAAQRVH